jgi:hypothetical protein
MHDQRPEQLTVSTSGKSLLIEVPSAHAGALLHYLRSQGVVAAPPSTYYEDVECIVLGKGTKAATVQSLLDRWKR